MGLEDEVFFGKNVAIFPNLCIFAVEIIYKPI